MKINNDFPTPELDPKEGRVGETAKTNRSAPVHPAGPDGGEDAVHVSARARALLGLSQGLDQVREAVSPKLSAIQQAVAESRYGISPDLVADRMLESLAKSPGGI